MYTAKRRLLGIAVGFASTVSMIAMAHAQGVLGNLANNDSVFVDGKTFSILAGKSKSDTAAEIRKLGATELGPGALIFRYGDKLYIADTPRVSAYLSDADVERQRALGLRDTDYERQRALGLRDSEYERQRPLGLRDGDYARQQPQGLRDSDYARQEPQGLRDTDIERQRPQGLRDADVARQQPQGLRDPDVARQQPRGLRDADIERQRPQGLRDAEIERQRPQGLRDADVARQQPQGLRETSGTGYRVYVTDPDYAYYKLKKTFEDNWAVTK